MSTMRRAWLASILLISAPTPTRAGTYAGTVDCSLAVGCAPGHPASNPTANIDKRTITYPLTFSQNGVSSTNLRACIAADGFGGNLTKAVEWAVEKWNARIPYPNNCKGCKPQELGDDGVPPPDHLPSTVLHELGHCAMALGHTTLVIDTADDPDTCTNPPPPPASCREFTSFTVSYNGTSNFGGLTAGADGVKGSKDDTQLNVGGMGQKADNVHWFRRADNDPLVWDLTQIDSGTYSPALNELPGGSSYTANANIGVGALLGQPHSESVMMRTRANQAVYFELSADDVNMIDMSRTGLNRVVGPLGGANDDHAIEIEIVSCASAHELEIGTVDLGEGLLGGCDARPDYLYSGAVIDYHLIGQAATPGVLHLALNTNASVSWNFDIPLFYGSFDSGDFDLGWTEIFP